MRRARLRLLSRSLLFLPASRHPAADSGFPSVTLMLATVLPAPGIAAVMPNGAIARKSSTDYPDKAPASSCGDSGMGQTAAVLHLIGSVSIAPESRPPANSIDHLFSARFRRFDLTEHQ